MIIPTDKPWVAGFKSGIKYTVIVQLVVICIIWLARV